MLVHPYDRIIGRIPLLVLPLVFLLAGCGDTPEAGAAMAAGEMQVASVFDAAIFDSIAWDTRGAALDRGATVYAYSCRKCHGDTGAGNGGYQKNGRTVRPPSFLAADWRFADDPQGLRRMIHDGGTRNMPHWGEAGLTPRDIDAVSRYIVRELWARAD